MHMRGALLVMVLLSLAVSPPHACAAEDTVTVLSAKDAKTRATRTGEVVEYTGESLQLKSLSGRIETIPAARVADVKTAWTPAHVRGDVLRAEGKLEEAITSYKQAKREEPRAWARRQIMAQLTACYAESGHLDVAGDEWLAIVASDQQTPHYAVIPIAWRPFAPDAAVETRAAAWLQSKTPTAQLLGASWLLTGPLRSEAVAVLDAVAADKTQDPRIRSLAQIQLWRTKLVTAKLDDAQRWQVALEQMPAEIRASGYFVVAEALTRWKQPEEAALAYLRIPLVHNEQRLMAADALVAAGNLHEQLGRGEQAAGLYREVLSGYSRTPAAEVARAKLEPAK
jgi:tetratricopeptide (TPR) repeat protein